MRLDREPEGNMGTRGIRVSSREEGSSHTGGKDLEEGGLLARRPDPTKSNNWAIWRMEHHLWSCSLSVIFFFSFSKHGRPLREELLT